MSDGTVDIYARLRAETAITLGLNLGALSPIQSLRLDLAVSLKLELDRIAAAQARGEPADLRALSSCSESLERLLRPAETASAPSHTPSAARLKLQELLERASVEAEVIAAERTARFAALEDEVAQLKEALARAGAVSAPAAAAPSASVVPLRPDPAELAKAREAARIKEEMTKPRNEEWRQSSTAAASTSTEFRRIGKGADSERANNKHRANKFS